MNPRHKRTGIENHNKLKPRADLLSGISVLFRQVSGNALTV